MTHDILTESQLFLPISTLAIALKHGNLCLQKHETYQRRSYRNKFDIATTHGKQTLSLPLASGKHQSKAITECQIAATQRQKDILDRSISSAYGSSPFWPYYGESVLDFIQTAEDDIYSLNKRTTEFIIQKMKLDIQIHETESYQKTIQGIDLRARITPRQPNFNNLTIAEYEQVFADRTGFIPWLSSIDLLFHCGPQSKRILNHMNQKF